MKDNKNLVFQMNKFVGDLYVFQTKVHNFHWNLVGEHFFVIHPMLDGIMAEIDTQIDTVAEKIIMIGHRPAASLKVFLDHTVIAEAESKPITGEAAVKAMMQDFKLLLTEIEISMKLAENLNDQGTITIFADLENTYKKHVWMFEAWLGQTKIG